MNPRDVATSIMVEAKVKKIDITKYTCWHVAIEFYKRMYSINLPDFSYNNPNMVAPDEVYKNWTVFENQEELQPGNLVVFKSNTVDGGLHTATFLGANEILHADYRVGIIIQKLSEADQKILYYARYNF